MKKTDSARSRAKMPEGSASILEVRTLKKDYRSLLPVVKQGMQVLDVGCGSGAITRGVADIVGPAGNVVGLDINEDLIERGLMLHSHISNLQLTHSDLFSYTTDKKFDLVIAARMLQWLNNPLEALSKICSLLKPGGIVSILDYNHEQLEWHPDPPQSMIRFYRAFLQWREEAGMNNHIADDLPRYVEISGFDILQTVEANENYTKKDLNFDDKLRIWSKVAKTRGLQMVKDGYIEESQRAKAVNEYNIWVGQEATSMTMKLVDVQGKKR